MEQKLTIKLSKEQVINIIKSFLIQDDNTQDQVDYDIEWRNDEKFKNFIIFTVIKKAYIGEYQGELKEELEDDTITQMLVKVFEIGEYSLDEWVFTLNTETDEFDGIELDLSPVKDKSFVMVLGESDTEGEDDF